MIIYKATNLINNKIYIGQTIKSVKSRSQDHKSDAKRRKYPFSRSIAKYGFENFKWEILEQCNSQNELDEKEIEWIDKLNSTNKNIGYNVAIGGNPGKDIGRKNLSKLWKTEEFRQKMKKATRKGAQKITEQQVADIKLYYSLNIPIRALSKYYKLTPSGIQGICYNINWKEIEKSNIIDENVFNILKQLSEEKIVKKSSGPKKKLTDEQISKIRYLKSIGFSANVCSFIFEISDSLSSKIFSKQKFPDILPCLENNFLPEELNKFKELNYEHKKLMLENQKKGLQIGWKSKQ